MDYGTYDTGWVKGNIRRWECTLTGIYYSIYLPVCLFMRGFVDSAQSNTSVNLVCPWGKAMEKDPSPAGFSSPAVSMTHRGLGLGPG